MPLRPIVYWHYNNARKSMPTYKRPPELDRPYPEELQVHRPKEPIQFNPNFPYILAGTLIGIVIAIAIVTFIGKIFK